jgi:hypothetical protein
MPVPVITPAGPLTKRGKDVQVFTATNGVDSWSTSGGTLSGTSSSGATWTAPNKSGTFTVTATNASGSTIVTITVTAVVPVVPSKGFEVETKKKVLLFEPDDGDRQTRTKGAKKKTWQFTTGNRKKSEFLELETFWNDNYPGGKVYFTHPYTSVESLYWIDSNLKEQWAFLNLVSYSFVLTEA